MIDRVARRIIGITLRPKKANRSRPRGIKEASRGRASDHRGERSRLEGALTLGVQSNASCRGGWGMGSEPLVQLGAEGESVRRLQQALISIGFSPGRVDGRFGPRTEAGVRAFQEAMGLVVDGVAGPRTWQTLL